MTSVSANPTDASAVKCSTAEIDISCRGPVLLLFVSAVLWLVFGSVIALIASIKLHAPAMLAECPWFTYGRLQAVQTDAFLYGFASEAAMGLAFWLLSQLGGIRLLRSSVASIAAVFWNIALAIGIVGIFAGDTTGYDWFEIPAYISPLFVFSFILFGVVAIATYHARVERTTFVSQWFLMAALFVLPWTLTTANLLLVIQPVRGVMQAVVNYWFVGNFLYLWLVAVAIATIFYFIPKLSGRPLNSYYLALFAFWSFVFLAGWCGVPSGAPLPRWMPALSGAARMLLLIPILALIANWKLTLSSKSTGAHPALRFMRTSAAALLIAGLLAAGSSLPVVNDVTEFTLFTAALSQLWLYGVVAMTFFGALYYIVPRLTLVDWPRPALVGAHFWAALIGILVLVIAFAIGGVKQGQAMNAGGTFLTIVKQNMPFIGMSTLGILLILLGNVLLLLNLFGMLAARCRACCKCGEKGGTR